MQRWQGEKAQGLHHCHTHLLCKGRETWSSPIVCAVLALDRWNYCSGEQAQQPNIIIHPTLNYKRNKVLPPFVKLPCHNVVLPLNQWSHARQTLRERCGAVRSALQNNSSNCLVLILQTIGKLFIQYLGKLWSESLTYTRLNISQCFTLT